MAIARALIGNPSVILADEPTGNLDSATAHDIMTLLLDLNREHAVTLIMVTHDAGLASLFQRRLQVRPEQCLKPARRRSPPMPDITHGPTFAWLLDEAVHSLRSLGRRSILALLGIMVGSAAIIALLNIGHNAAEVMRAFRQMGTDRLVVNFPIVQNARPLPATVDAAALRQAVPALSRVAPLFFATAVRHGGKTAHARLIGATADLAPVINLTMATGRFLSEFDQKSTFAVVGAQLARELEKKAARCSLATACRSDPIF